MPYLICGQCGQEFLGKKGRVYCCASCRSKAMAKEASAARRKNRGLSATKHKCHDCGKPTPDHRCPACLAKWRKKHGVAISETDGID